jgi:hypothetical protein
MTIPILLPSDTGALSLHAEPKFRDSNDLRRKEKVLPDSQRAAGARFTMMMKLPWS